MWPFARISAMVVTMPLFGTSFAPMQIRLYLAIGLTAVIYPLLPAMPQVDALSAEGVLIMTHQIVIGIAMGTLLQLMFAGFTIGGQVIAMKIGLGFSMMVDPIAGNQVPVLGMLYTLMTGLLFLSFDGHLHLFQLLADSFTLLPVGSSGIGREAVWSIVAFSGRIFQVGMMVAITTVAAILIVMLAFGVVTKAAPQFNIFSVGMPIFMILGFFVLLLTLPQVVVHFSREMEAAFSTLTNLFNGR